MHRGILHHQRIMCKIPNPTNFYKGSGFQVKILDFHIWMYKINTFMQLAGLQIIYENTRTYRIFIEISDFRCLPKFKILFGIPNDLRWTPVGVRPPVMHIYTQHYSCLHLHHSHLYTPWPGQLSFA